jgi:DNA-binding NarL/FixJ family response regulator
LMTRRCCGLTARERSKVHPMCARMVKRKNPVRRNDDFKTLSEQFHLGNAPGRLNEESLRDQPEIVERASAHRPASRHTVNVHAVKRTGHVKGSQETKAVKVLIVDAYPAIREALALRISTQPDMCVCGEAADAVEALHCIDTTSPDVAVIDISVRKSNGIDLIERIKARNAKLRVLVWSVFAEALYAERALHAGAMGYVSKEEATVTIVKAIRSVLEDKVYLSETIAAKLLRGKVGGVNPDTNRSPIESLSDRELEVFRQIGQGRKPAEIALHLHLSPRTVETYRDRIREKLKLSNSAELARAAFQWVLEGN